MVQIQQINILLLFFANVFLLFQKSTQNNLQQNSLYKTNSYMKGKSFSAGQTSFSSVSISLFESIIHSVLNCPNSTHHIQNLAEQCLFERNFIQQQALQETRWAVLCKFYSIFNNLSYSLTVCNSRRSHSFFIRNL